MQIKIKFNEARIISVADVVCSMTEYKPYRPAQNVREALEDIELGSGKLYDQEVVSACLELFRVDGYEI